MAATIIAAIGLAASLATTAYGIAQQKKAEKIRRNNPRPTYTIAPEVFENKQLTESRAGTGLPDYVTQYYKQGNERALTATLDKILKGGGSSAEAAPAMSTYNDAMSRLATADDARQYQNMQNLLDQNRRMEDTRDKEWQVNQYGPYADKAQLAAETARAGAQYIQSGINTAASSLGSYASAKGQQKDTKKVLDTGGDNSDSGAGQVSKTATGIDYSPSLMNSGTGQRYMSMDYNDDLLKAVRAMTPQQRQQINNLYSGRLNLDVGGTPNSLNYFNANTYRY